MIPRQRGLALAQPICGYIATNADSPNLSTGMTMDKRARTLPWTSAQRGPRPASRFTVLNPKDGADKLFA